LPTFIKKYPGIQVQVYEVLSDPQANQRFAELVAQHRIAGASYPGFNFCQHLVIGFDNEKDMADIPKNVLDTMNIYLVETMDEVLRTALAGPLPVVPPSPEADLPASDLETRH